MRINIGTPVVLFFEQTLENDFLDWFYIYRTDTGKKTLFTYTVQTNEIIIIDYAYVTVSVTNTTGAINASTSIAMTVVKDSTTVHIPIASCNISISSGSGSAFDKVFPGIILTPGRRLEIAGWNDRTGVTVFHGAGIHFRRYKKEL